jgi:hypothetical protein
MLVADGFAPDKADDPRGPSDGGGVTEIDGLAVASVHKLNASQCAVERY